eukprot:7360134-Ditylum_brightwellii.AAC.1
MVSVVTAMMATTRTRYGVLQLLSYRQSLASHKSAKITSGVKWSEDVLQFSLLQTKSSKPHKQKDNEWCQMV